jgi:23S rRNA pseudouridine1911/1915/1917 synthase
MTPPRKISLKTEPSHSNLRLDRFLHQCFPEHSRSFFQKLIEQGRVRVEGRSTKPALKLAPGQQVEVEFPEPVKSSLEPENFPLDIIYQDEYLVVVNKPAGMVVHPGAGVREHTLVHALLYHVGTLSSVGGESRPGIVHRLDKNTSGLLVVARTDEAHYALSQQFASKQAQRQYLALVWHLFDEPEGTIETFLNRSKRDRKKFIVADRGKRAVTHYRVQQNFGFLSLVELRLETGRTHQIRVHLSAMHHPVFGDPEYHGRSSQISRLTRSEDRQLAHRLLKMMPHQALHAYQLQFVHPFTKEWVTFRAELPENFRQVLHELEMVI